MSEKLEAQLATMSEMLANLTARADAQVAYIGNLERTLALRDAEITRLKEEETKDENLYLSSVQGRRDFRQAYRDALTNIRVLEAQLATREKEVWEEAAKIQFRLVIQRAIEEIPVNNPSYISPIQETLRRALSRGLLERIADEAEKAVVALLRSRSSPALGKEDLADRAARGEWRDIGTAPRDGREIDPAVAAAALSSTEALLLPWAEVKSVLSVPTGPNEYQRVIDAMHEREDLLRRAGEVLTQARDALRPFSEVIDALSHTQDLDRDAKIDTWTAVHFHGPGASGGCQIKANDFYIAHKARRAASTLAAEIAERKE